MSLEAAYISCVQPVDKVLVSMVNSCSTFHSSGWWCTKGKGKVNRWTIKKNWILDLFLSCSTDLWLPLDQTKARWEAVTRICPKVPTSRINGHFTRMKMKIKKMKKKKTQKKKWEDKMKEKEPLQCWIVNIMSSTNPFY